MCGIAGFVDPAGHTPDPDRVVRRMRESLRHRGPDDAGELVAPPVWLGHRRLAVVGPGPGGRQPFVERDAAGRAEVAAVANAEIYNHEALRARLAAHDGDGALPASDCAVLPGLWRLEGSGLPEELSGMFALAVWDARRHELLLARDPAGQKPLYHAPLPGGGLAFASELKALLHHPLVRRRVDPVGLRRYLAFDCVPGEATIYEGVRRIPPGGRLHWCRGETRRDRHHAIPSGRPPLRRRGRADRALWEALGRSVSARRMADVPQGVFLSGGLDSAALVAALAERIPARELRTFSVGFRDPSVDESDAARAVARHFGTDHREERLEPEALVEMVPEILSVLDEPFADPSIVPTWLLSRFAAREVTVAMGGDGGDELLLGYPTFPVEPLARAAARLPAALRREWIPRAVSHLPVTHRHMSLDFKLRRFLLGLELAPERRHRIWIGGLHPAEHHEAVPSRWLERADDEAVFAELDGLAAHFAVRRPDAPALERIAWIYFQSYLADGVLTKVDRASMAHGLEVRAPFLDREMLEVGARIPLRHKLAPGRTKAPLRRLLASRVPRSVVRRPKSGFGIPVASWLRGRLRPWMESVLDRRRVAEGGLLNPDWTDRQMALHLSGRADCRKELWSAIALELWRCGPWGPS